jgi:hypothetical protein
VLDPSLRATLEQRVREMEVAKTVEASPTATIKPAARPVGQTHPGPDPKRLPRISLDATPARGISAEEPPRDLELRALLGEGGMGRVHAAFQRSLEREVAIKTLREVAGPSAATALLREALVTGTLEHPGVVPVHALGVDESGAPVLVMKRIEGVQWADLIHDARHPAWAKRPGDRQTAHVEIVMQICQTVQFAHARGLVHRDIKPENVMLGDFGETYVVDWGIALRLSGEATEAALAGTPAYMAPEMVTGTGIDERTDVYLLGASLHEALTGEAKNQGDTMETVLSAALLPEPHDYGPKVPAELAEICNRATSRAPKDRFQSAEHMRLALAEYLQHRGSAALARRAAERSVELEAVLSATEAAPADLQRSYQLASEARFACAEALRTWPENARAKQELQRCLGLIVDLELRQGHLSAADAIAREIERPSQALSEKLERARAAHAEAAAEQERLRALAKDLDVRVASRQRQVSLVLLCLGALSVVAAIARGVNIDREAMFGISVVFLVLALTVTGLLRKKLLANAFNRRASALLLVALAVLVTARGAAIAADLTIAQIVVQDLVIVTAFCAAAAITLLPWLWLMLPIDLGALAVALGAPQRAQLALALAYALVPAVCVYALHREGRRNE